MEVLELYPAGRSLWGSPCLFKVQIPGPLPRTFDRESLRHWGSASNSQGCYETFCFAQDGSFQQRGMWSRMLTAPQLENLVPGKEQPAMCILSGAGCNRKLTVLDVCVGSGYPRQSFLFTLFCTFRSQFDWTFPRKSTPRCSPSSHTPYPGSSLSKAHLLSSYHRKEGSLRARFRFHLFIDGSPTPGKLLGP